MDKSLIICGPNGRTGKHTFKVFTMGSERKVKKNGFPNGPLKSNELLKVVVNAANSGSFVEKYDKI